MSASRRRRLNCRVSAFVASSSVDTSVIRSATAVGLVVVASAEVQIYSWTMADDNDVRGHINSLIEVERNLRRQMDDGKITTQQERERLRRVQKQLDGYWSLLRERDGEPVS